MVQVKESAEAEQANEPAEWRDFGVFDIETGGLPEEQLRELWQPKTKDEFAASCDKRWGADAIARNYEKYCAGAFDSFRDKAALNATSGTVVAIGIDPCSPGGMGPGIIPCDGDGTTEEGDEVSGLRVFWRWVGHHFDQQIPMVGWNIHGFDLPFLVRRSWILGIDVPLGVRKGRYFNDLFVDLMQVWMCGGRDYVKLDVAARACGLGEKVTEVDGVEVSGATFATLWRENRQVAEQYLMRDLELPAKLAVKMGVV